MMMKKLLLVLSLLAMNAYACPKDCAMSDIDNECLLSDKLCYVFKDEKTGKAGVKDKDGKIIVSAKYDGIYDADDSETGNGHLKTTIYKHSSPYDTIYGILDKTGKEIIKPHYESIQITKYGFIVSNDSFYGFLDLAGKEILPPIYQDLEVDSETGNMTARVSQDILFNSKGKTIIQSHSLLNVGDNYTIFNQHTSNGMRWGVVDKTGKIVIPAIYHDLLPLRDDVSYETYPLLVAGNDKGKKALIDINTGKPLTDFRYDGIIEYILEDMVMIKIDDKYGFIDTKGKEVIKPIYDKADLFVAGLSLVGKDGEIFYIDKMGKRVPSPQN